MEQVVHRGYKYRIYPTDEQKQFFMKIFGCRRKIYNTYVDALYTQLENLGYQNGYINLKSLHFDTPASLKRVFPYLKEADSLALCNAQLAFRGAVARFNKEFDKVSYTKRAKRRLKNLGITPTFRDLKGMPRFKSAKAGDFSYTTNNQSNDGKWSNITLQGSMLHIPKFATDIVVKVHRPLPKNCIIKNATISMDVRGHFSVSLGVEYVADISPVEPKTFLGLDYSQSNFFVDSEGKKANYPHYYRQAEVKLAREQRKLSHMVEGSNNWVKQKRRVSLLQGKVANQRRDWLHNQSTAIANNFDMVAVEDIDLRALSQTLRLAKNLQDNGFGMFRTMLKYKLEERGKQFVKIDRYYPSSKTCRHCGYVYAELQLERQWTCPCCHSVIDRDCNAAINIREVGKSMLLLS